MTGISKTFTFFIWFCCIFKHCLLCPTSEKPTCEYDSDVSLFISVVDRSLNFQWNLPERCKGITSLSITARPLNNRRRAIKKVIHYPADARRGEITDLQYSTLYEAILSIHLPGNLSTEISSGAYRIRNREKLTCESDLDVFLFVRMMERDLIFQWDLPDRCKGVTSFSITAKPLSNRRREIMKVIHYPADLKRGEINDLQFSTTYEAILTIHFVGNLTRQISGGTYRTRNPITTRPLDFQLQPIVDGKINLTWNRPSILEGNPSSYTLLFTEDKDIITIEINPTATSCVITGLQQKTQYSFTLSLRVRLYQTYSGSAVYYSGSPTKTLYYRFPEENPIILE